MATEYISLDDAAKTLGIPADKLVQMRSAGLLRGFKDGVSWKFPVVEIERLRSEGLDDLASDMASDMASNDGSNDAILGGGFHSDNASASDFDIRVAMPVSEENLLGDLTLESNESVFLNPVDDASQSNSDGAIVPGLSNPSSLDLVLGLHSPSQEDVLRGLSSDLDGDADHAPRPIDVTSGSEMDLVLPEPSQENEIPEALFDEEIPEARSPRSEIRIPEQAPAGSIVDDSDDDLDLSLDREPALEAPSDALDIDLTLAEPALSDAIDLGLSDHEPATGESDLNLGGDDPSDLDIVPASLNDSAINPPSVDLGQDSDSEPPSDLNLDIETPSKSPGASDVLSQSVSDIDLASAHNPSSDGSSDLYVDQSGRISLAGSDLGIPGGGASGVLGSGISSGISSGSGSMIDPSLAPDDDGDLVISEDGELILDETPSGLSGVSVVNESGINLMAPSDSGLSLESEPLDLAGSSISALDLGTEASDVSPGSASSSHSPSDSGGSLVDFQADDEFQLSPGMGLEFDEDSASQVIDVEDSNVMDAMAQPVLDIDQDDALGGFDDGDAMGIAVADDMTGEAIAIDDDEHDESSPEAIIDTSRAQPKSLAPPVNELQFTTFSVLALAGLALVLLFVGMVAADVGRNLATETGAQSVSPLTAALIKIVCY